MDYTLLTSHRTHAFRTYGSFDLPLGPGQLVAGNSSGVLARLMEGWQTSWIVNLTSGLPQTISAANMLYGRGTPDQVREFDFDAVQGVQWEDGAPAGNYFGNVFTKVDDPQCLAIAASLQNFCTLNAIADTSGNLILQNAQPGTRGNVGLQTIEGAGVWTADMAIAKIFRITESVRGQVRMDAKNIFNHPTPGAPGAGFGAAPNDGGSQLNLNDTNPFGNMPLKGASVPQSPAARQFQFKVRVDLGSFRRRSGSSLSCITGPSTAVRKYRHVCRDAVGAVYDRPQCLRSRAWAVIDRPYNASRNCERQY